MKNAIRNIVPALFLSIFTIGMFGLSTGVMADNLSPDESLQTLKQNWAVAMFQTEKGEKQHKALKSVVADAETLLAANPKNAETLTWNAIVLSSYAGASKGLGALKLAKQSRARLHQAEKIDPTVANGSVYSSLGTLYAKVPSWPIGFGSSKKAKYYLQKALEVNPTGMEPNLFYAEYLLDKGKKQDAIVYLEKALQAPAREHMPIVDAGRKVEIENLLKQLSSM